MAEGYVVTERGTTTGSATLAPPWPQECVGVSPVRVLGDVLAERHEKAGREGHVTDGLGRLRREVLPADSGCALRLAANLDVATQEVDKMSVDALTEYAKEHGLSKPDEGTQ